MQMLLYCGHLQRTSSSFVHASFLLKHQLELKSYFQCLPKSVSPSHQFPFSQLQFCEKPLKTFKLRASNKLSECLSFTSVRQPSISGNKSALESLMTSLSAEMIFIVPQLGN